MIRLYNIKETLQEFYPKHEENKMKDEGDVESARKYFIENRPKNLEFLLHQRYNWMNEYIGENQRIIEIGSGAGFAQFFLKEKIILSDIVKRDFIDIKIDALNIDLPNNSVNTFICSHMIHHIAKPLIFLKNLEKKLIPGGHVLIQEINTSILMRLILFIMKHEGYSYKKDVFNENVISNDPSDPWSANCAIPDLLFKDISKFESNVPLKILLNEFNEFLIFPLSGGVIAKSKTIELPFTLLKLVNLLDKIMIKLMPSICAFGRSVVLQKPI